MPSSTRVHTVLCLANVEILTDSAEVTNFRIIYASNTQRAYDVLGSTVVDALVVLLPVAGEKAEELLRGFCAHTPEAPVLVYEPTPTGDPGSEFAGLSGCEYISGPVSGSDLLERLCLAFRARNNEAACEAREDDEWARALVGSSSALRQVVEIIRLVGPRRSTILITGETGSGKEVAAKNR